MIEIEKEIKELKTRISILENLVLKLTNKEKEKSEANKKVAEQLKQLFKLES